MRFSTAIVIIQPRLTPRSQDSVVCLTPRSLDSIVCMTIPAHINKFLFVNEILYKNKMKAKVCAYYYY